MKIMWIDYTLRSGKTRQREYLWLFTQALTKLQDLVKNNFELSGA